MPNTRLRRWAQRIALRRSAGVRASDQGEDIQKGVPVGIIIEDVFAPVSARGNVVQRAWKFDPDWA